MKVIDLLIKNSNGEKVYKFKHKDKIYYLACCGDYILEGNSRIHFNFNDLKILNDEIEIIDEEPKKIEKIKINSMGNIVDESNYTLPVTSETDEFLARKINEIINYINREY